MNNPPPGPAHGKSNPNCCYTGSSTSCSHCHQPQHFAPSLSHSSFPLHPQSSCSQTLPAFLPGFPKFLSYSSYSHHCEILGSRHNHLKLLPTLKVTKTSNAPANIPPWPGFKEAETEGNFIFFHFPLVHHLCSPKTFSHPSSPLLENFMDATNMIFLFLLGMSRVLYSLAKGIYGLYRYSL